MILPLHSVRPFLSLVALQWCRVVFWAFSGRTIFCSSLDIFLLKTLCCLWFLMDAFYASFFYGDNELLCVWCSLFLGPCMPNSPFLDSVCVCFFWREALFYHSFGLRSRGSVVYALFMSSVCSCVPLGTYTHPASLSTLAL